jgi:hypothetical protein
MKTVQHLRTIAFGAAVATALGFGAARAADRPASVLACGDPGADFSCISSSGCTFLCRKYGLGNIGSCNTTTGCCYCTIEP